jgi:hypothetical protein
MGTPKHLPILIASYPRSGYHLIDDILVKYFHFKTAKYNIDCCKGAECKDPADTNPLQLHRTHDFHGKTDPAQYSKIITLYRSDPVEQIDAYIRFIRLQMKYNHSMSTDDHCTFHSTQQPYTIQEIRHKYIFYNQFLNKWILQPPTNSLVIDYNTLVSEPVKTLSEIQLFLFGDCNSDLSEKITSEMKIEKKNTISHEEYSSLSAILQTL